MLVFNFLFLKPDKKYNENNSDYNNDNCYTCYLNGAG